MACGAPTFARDTPYNREVLGSAGRFVSPNSSDIERGVLAGMADAQWQTEAISQGLQRVADTYTWEKVCQAYEINLLDLLHGQNRALSGGVDSVAGAKK